MATVLFTYTGRNDIENVHNGKKSCEISGILPLPGEKKVRRGFLSYLHARLKHPQTHKRIQQPKERLCMVSCFNQYLETFIQGQIKIWLLSYLK
jgi:hypothetical protein